MTHGEEGGGAGGGQARSGATGERVEGQDRPD